MMLEIIYWTMGIGIIWIMIRYFYKEYKRKGLGKL